MAVDGTTVIVTSPEGAGDNPTAFMFDVVSDEAVLIDSVVINVGLLLEVCVCVCVCVLGYLTKEDTLHALHACEFRAVPISRTRWPYLGTSRLSALRSSYGFLF